ncbi:hypothetical protein PILCRDRAFT_447099 [Piloderma croceum F 1598]|uniref:Uncharacterized protein n=1 Tax=Piloderma croceum (strain F 1598) TaxID=765440 RepID=A0A0C3B9J1_PILCF|nr:hypothetical protein PILCRDRAFT_447099 [Piloderma croceum F 1598]
MLYSTSTWHVWFPPIWLVPSPDQSAKSITSHLRSSRWPFCSITEKINNAKAKIRAIPPNQQHLIFTGKGAWPSTNYIYLPYYDLDSIPLATPHLRREAAGRRAYHFGLQYPERIHPSLGPSSAQRYTDLCGREEVQSSDTINNVKAQISPLTSNVLFSPVNSSRITARCLITTFRRG